MTKKERNEIIKFAENLTNEVLEHAKMLDAIYSSLGSQCEDMYELGYDSADIVEREKYEKHLWQRATLLGALWQATVKEAVKAACECCAMVCETIPK